MKSTQTAKFKQNLLDNRRELIEDLMITNENFSNLDHVKVGDLVDQASNFYQKELLIGLSTSEKETLSAIDKALEKINNEMFGQCEACGDTIDEKRLEAIPYTPLCVECKKNNNSNKVRNEGYKV
ncbi:MAG TPA: TraR/DksA family transcriptional regulator [Spirochaetes bacterium]|nr:TraR/DksA family transcriptional regulator [Spirochaetota bacterium]